MVQRSSSAPILSWTRIRGRFITSSGCTGGTLVGIHKFPDLKSTEPFDERRPGLDHLAFACSNRAELEEWEHQLNSLGVANGGIVDASYGSGLSFRDPDNIALEFSPLGVNCSPAFSLKTDP